MSAGFYLGVDGGGTKTEFVCIDAAGAVIARAVTGTTYHLEVGEGEAVRRIAEGVSSVCTQIGAAPAHLAHVFLGLPAYGEDSAVDPRLDAAVRDLLGHARYRCGNDMVCGWAGSLACADGINVVAGTGSIAYGERGGRGARAGGWGEVFGDEGSAYWIAREGLAAFSRMSDGRAAVGPLHGLLREALALDDDLALCERVMGPRGMARGELAALATIVSRAAEEGDEAARAILAAAAAELVLLATALRVRLGFDPAERVAVSWSGGVLANVSAVRYAFATGLKAAGCTAVEPLHAPGYGAALYARHLAQR
ncbi:N-acetylglucosamine kinase [Sphingomonas yunnanensis]|uniref:N-acetylglucosamine kinase n=1 Tax=Sphingomonas yunnanensis TaxID=310400 RepID=UPI001CA6D5B0|nr:BadF/BadG/BcrA/BcrD ATPase family protein [Sphingomonas yunnanensis]MBY9062052.1 N-acetylglucosamine kinase [Sphingomonas yunnanensis]